MKKRIGLYTILLTGLTALGTSTISSSALADDVLVVVGDQVGINTNTPATGASLHVKAASTGPVDAIFLENTTGPARLNLQNLSITPSAIADPKWTINSNGDLRFTAGTDGAEMRLDASGNLKVVGSFIVNATTLNVPDYVFKPDYPLMPLKELKSFLKKNHHLPEVHSESDIKRDGLDMTNMQMQLLRKVEELTLYTLQQQEEIESLKGKLNKE